MKKLPIGIFILGIFFWFSGGERYFHKSGGTGLILALVVAPLVAIGLRIFEKVNDNSTKTMTSSFRSGLAVFGAGALFGLIGWAASSGFHGFEILGIVAISGILMLVGTVMIVSSK